MTDLKKSLSDGNCHRMETVWKVLLQGLTFIGNVEINARWLQMGPTGTEGVAWGEISFRAVGFEWCWSSREIGV